MESKNSFMDYLELRNKRNIILLYINMSFSLMSSMGSYAKTRKTGSGTALSSQMTAFKTLIASKAPWAMYSAESYSSNVLPELRAQTTKNATCVGVSKTTGSGNGSSASIPYISGGSNTSTITFPSNSIPTNFTICSITRYTGPSYNRILATPSQATNNWLHGHHQNKRGVVYYNAQLAPFANVGTLTDWVVMCGKSGSNPSGNILIDGTASGNASGGATSGNTLAINVDTVEKSDYAFSQLFIWDQVLTDAELVVVSNALRQHLIDGVSFTNAL